MLVAFGSGSLYGSLLLVCLFLLGPCEHFPAFLAQFFLAFAMLLSHDAFLLVHDRTPVEFCQTVQRSISSEHRHDVVGRDDEEPVVVFEICGYGL